MSGAPMSGSETTRPTGALSQTSAVQKNRSPLQNSIAGIAAQQIGLLTFDELVRLAGTAGVDPV